MIRLIIFDWDDVFTLGSIDGYKWCYHEAVVVVLTGHLNADQAKQLDVRHIIADVTRLESVLGSL